MAGEPIDSETSYRSYSGDDSQEHDRDKPGGTIRGPWLGLCDAEGVDKGIREVEERLHGF